MIGLAQAIIAAVALQRLVELAWAQRNTKRLLARGQRKRAPAIIR